MVEAASRSLKRMWQSGVVLTYASVRIDLLGALERTAHFLAWGNFSDPHVLWLWSKSLLLLAVVMSLAWIAGEHACRALQYRSPREEFVLKLTSGLAVLA